MEGYPGPDLPYLAEIQAFLEANRPEPSPTGIIHGDYHLANVMFRPDAGEIAAIVDWELATQGDPLIDLGLVVAFGLEADGAAGMMSIQPWDGFPRSTNFVAHYDANSPAISAHSTGTPCLPVTRPASSSRAPMPGPLPARRPRSSATCCMPPRSGSSKRQAASSRVTRLGPCRLTWRCRSPGRGGETRNLSVGHQEGLVIGDQGSGNTGVSCRQTVERLVLLCPRHEKEAFAGVVDERGGHGPASVPLYSALTATSVVASSDRRGNERCRVRHRRDRVGSGRASWGAGEMLELGQWPASAARSSSASTGMG